MELYNSKFEHNENAQKRRLMEANDSKVLASKHTAQSKYHYTTDENHESSDDEPILKKLKIMPSDETITKYIRKILVGVNLESLTMKNVYEKVCSKYPSVLEKKKYFIKRTVESDEEVKKFITEYLRESDLSTINVRSVCEHVKGKYKSFENLNLIKDIVDSYLKQYSQEIAEEIKQPADTPLNTKARATLETFQIIQIGDNKSKTINYYDNEGFVYSIKNKNKTGSNKYLRCKNKELYQCNARATVRNNNLEEVILMHRHNHLAEEKHKDRVKFNKKLEQICRECPFYTPRACYQRAKIQLRGEIDRKYIPSLKSFESLIYRNQKVDIPPLPKTISELEELICDLKYGRRYTHDEKGNMLFRGVWKGSTGDNVVFVSESTLEQVRKVQHLQLLMDGTFKVLPCHLKFRQLYIINTIINKRSYPLAFILMEKKDTVSYELIFSKLKALISSKFITIQGMTDYEAATRKAFKKVFPTADIYGCYFHYVQAITKAFRRYGLNKTDCKFDGTMEKIAALALLPENYVLAGFESIAKNYKKSKTFARFKDYWMKQWAGANISVYGLKYRTNNYAESLNKSINLLIGNKHPHIWRLIHNLVLVEMDKSDELLRVVAGEMIHKKRSKEMKRLNKKIKDATSEFKKSLDVEIFLKNVTFNEKMVNFFKERIYIDGLDDKQYDDKGEEDEEIIPNDLRQSSNFRVAFPRKATRKSKN